jgi:DNA polymerase-3 subunit delta
VVQLLPSGLWFGDSRQAGRVDRVLPSLTDSALAQLLQSAHLVDGIVKGLMQPDWPTDPWQALARLAMTLCGLCAAAPNKAGRRVI